MRNFCNSRSADLLLSSAISGTFFSFTDCGDIGLYLLITLLQMFFVINMASLDLLPKHSPVYIVRSLRLWVYQALPFLQDSAPDSLQTLAGMDYQSVPSHALQ